MKSVKKVLLLLTLSSAALAVPAMASASVWTKEGVPISLGTGGKTPAWTNEGELLSGTTSVSLNGPVKFSSIIGTIECSLSASGTISEPNSGSISTASVTGCKLGGALKECEVTSATAAGLSWSLTPQELSGVKSISLPGMSIAYEFKACFVSELTFSGNVTATPNDSGAIGSLSLSGTVTSKQGTKATASGSLSVTPSGKLGITNQYWGPEVKLDGNLGYSNTFPGGVSCPVDGTIKLVGGTDEGAITALAWDAEACSLGGSLPASCEKVTSVTSKLLPWPVINEGTSIRITEFPISINFSKCGSKTFQGELTATPDKVGAISSTSIAGFLETGSGGEQLWGGSLSWTPAGVYGLQ